MGGTPTLGAISIFGFSFAPRNFAYCNGGLMQVTQNTALFALLGTTYGGNGQSTFGLPNLQGRAPVHAGQLAGGSNYQLGQASGTESVTLNQTQLPPHTHGFSATGSFNAANAQATSAVPAAGTVLGGGTDQDGTDTPQIYAPTGSTANIALGGLNVAGQIGITGNGQPVSILQPILVMNFCIATQGIFPTRN